MATLTIKNIPERVYQQLKRQAARHHRSLNQEVISCLEHAAGSVPFDPTAILARARELRLQVKAPILTEKRLAQLKNAGRP
jgi:plasmid stability protein